MCIRSILTFRYYWISSKCTARCAATSVPRLFKGLFLFTVSDPTPIANGGCTTYDKHRHSGYLGSPTPITNGNVHVLRQNGGKCSTLPRSNRRNTTQISYYEVQEAATHNRPILKSSPVKLIPPGRIEVIKEEVEIEVATNSCLKSTMHRSVEVSELGHILK